MPIFIACVVFVWFFSALLYAFHPIHPALLAEAKCIPIEYLAELKQRNKQHIPGEYNESDFFDPQEDPLDDEHWDDPDPNCIACMGTGEYAPSGAEPDLVLPHCLVCGGGYWSGVNSIFATKEDLEDVAYLDKQILMFELGIHATQRAMRFWQ